MKPILFSTHMVKAILAGRKTQTRRIYNYKTSSKVPTIGDTLYVKETFAYAGDHSVTAQAYKHTDVIYRASSTGERLEEFMGWTWRPSIFMPKTASRIHLKVTNVHIQNLWEITREDAAAEGMCYLADMGIVTMKQFPEDNFRDVWDAIHSKNKHQMWFHNPQIYALTFEVISL